MLLSRLTLHQRWVQPIAMLQQQRILSCSVENSSKQRSAGNGVHWGGASLVGCMQQCSFAAYVFIKYFRMAVCCKDPSRRGGTIGPVLWHSAL
eukprot:5235164-Amphidinium_carterae.1